MRTFVALNLQPAIRNRLHDTLAPLRERMGQVRWVTPDALHLTLKFLGEIDAGATTEVEAALRQTAGRHSPIRLRIGGRGAFPSLRRARVLWVGADGGDALHALHGDVETTLALLGFGRERRPFRPHITVGRVRTDARPPDLTAMPDPGFAASETIMTIDFMRSQTYPDGARYEPIAGLKLGQRQ